MKLQPGLVFAGLLALGLSTYSCANGDTVSGDTGSGGNGSGSGGSNNSGGSTGSGGSQNKGGSTGSGGSKGGSTGSGGSVVTTGGNTGSGGAKGGTTGSGGNSTSTGGTTGSSGGTTGSSGGTTGSGGSSSNPCGSTFAVSPVGFVSMPAVGGRCWTGFASDGGDSGSTISPGAFSACGMPCMLTMTGMVNASVAPSYAGYSYLGFNVGQGSGGGTNTAVVPKGSGITVTFTNTGNSPVVRVALNADAAATTSWCAPVTTSPANIPYSSFTQQCYNTPTGAAYGKQGIVSVQLSVPGGAAVAPVNITLVSVVENP